jgi:hypothetical protein
MFVAVFIADRAANGGRIGGGLKVKDRTKKDGVLG